MKNNLLCCSQCNKLVEEHICPQCGSSAKEPQSGDMCFICELDEMGKSMFADALQNNDIEFIAVPVHGGYALMNKPNSYKLYVRYEQYDEALQVYDVLWGGNNEPESDVDDQSVIDRLVKVTIDRPFGSVHPKHPDIVYKLNYGYVEGVMGGDGEWQDAYVMGVSVPLRTFDGYVIAVIVRKNDVETKWVVAPIGARYTKDEIAQAVHFQEQYFDIEIIM